MQVAKTQNDSNKSGGLAALSSVFNSNPVVRWWRANSFIWLYRLVHLFALVAWLEGALTGWAALMLVFAAIAANELIKIRKSVQG